MRAFIVASFIFAISSMSVNAAPDQSSKPVSKKQAVQLAKQAERGKTLKITELEQSYTVRILKNDGHVVDIHVNKKTGEVKKD